MAHRGSLGQSFSRLEHDLARDLFERGFREITLLGQNVNSYEWTEGTEKVTFAGLLEQVALISPLLRVRFATSHPKGISDELLHVIARHENLCKAIHLPVQSGSDHILDLMNRKYTAAVPHRNGNGAKTFPLQDLYVYAHTHEETIGNNDCRWTSGTNRYWQTTRKLG